MADEFEAELQAAISAQRSRSAERAESKAEAEELGRFLAQRLAETGQEPLGAEVTQAWILYWEDITLRRGSSGGRAFFGVTEDGTWVSATSHDDEPMLNLHWGPHQDWRSIVDHRSKAMDALARRLSAVRSDCQAVEGEVGLIEGAAKQRAANTRLKEDLVAKLSVDDDHERVLRAMACCSVIEPRKGLPVGYRITRRTALDPVIPDFGPDALDAVIPDFSAPRGWRSRSGPLEGRTPPYRQPPYLQPDWKAVAPVSEASLLQWFAARAAPQQIERVVVHRSFLRGPREETVKEQGWKLEGGAYDSWSDGGPAPDKEPAFSPYEARIDVGGQLSNDYIWTRLEVRPWLTTVGIVRMGQLLGFDIGQLLGVDELGIDLPNSEL